MMVGHYSAAFAAKALTPKAPLWALFVAVQFVDIFWAGFILTGVERGRLDPTLASNPLVLEHMPYTHSLVGTVAFAALGAGLAFALFRDARAAAAVGVAVLSHWVLDVVVHRPDMTLLGAEPRLGLRLWDAPVLALGLEVALFAGAIAWCVKARGWTASAKTFAVVAVVLSLVQVGSTLGPPPPSIEAIAVLGLVTFLGLPALARWLERRAVAATGQPG